ncbi:coproporphyrinogen-III oxidase family protein [Parasporobacterium paucivorans]|uniref:Heme chaperone HemW n=1 Tax=Parasporobacterium paucivorans DSM 15970 TaxID=1122934 RepID=A0A1M6DRD1_9FIRM|nr:radical SAM protein [Parasporobacterium paucivorans]SHI75743.1 oxygen-independent coproporphyrinogen-3 oxidase [Parasporobacterium paucivorans DSM 15970]
MLLTSLFRFVLTRSFKPFVFRGKHANKLEFEKLESLGLYVHIPFCRSLCSFCPYCKEVYNKEKADRYKRALLKEIDLACRFLRDKKNVISLYFGGGTPALMIDDLKDIIAKLEEFFVIQEGIGVELHPSDITEETLRKLQSAGVTMVSLGIQSFHEECLNKLGRTGSRFIEKLQLVKSYGFEVIDVDLIFAIPGQTDKILADDINAAFSNGATQVSTYPFIDFTFADNKYKPMPEKIKKRMLENLAQYCHSINLERTSVWTFAQQGTKKYSSVTRDTFLGFGVSATTLLRTTFKINTFSIEEYISRVEADRLPTSLTLSFTKRQRASYYLFWGAYSMRINKEGFKKIIGTELEKMYGMEIFIARRLGYLRKKGDSYELTDKAILLYHHIEQVYTTAYIDKMWNVSRLQAFPDKIILK